MIQNLVIFYWDVRKLSPLLPRNQIMYIIDMREINPRWLGVYRSGQVKLLKHLSLTPANGTLCWIKILILVHYVPKAAGKCARVKNI